MWHVIAASPPPRRPCYLLKSLCTVRCTGSRASRANGAAAARHSPILTGKSACALQFQPWYRPGGRHTLTITYAPMALATLSMPGALA